MLQVTKARSGFDNTITFSSVRVCECSSVHENPFHSSAHHLHAPFLQLENPGIRFWISGAPAHSSLAIIDSPFMMLSAITMHLPWPWFSRYQYIMDFLKNHLRNRTIFQHLLFFSVNSKILHLFQHWFFNSDSVTVALLRRGMTDVRKSFPLWECNDPFLCL